MLWLKNLLKRCFLSAAKPELLPVPVAARAPMTSMEMKRLVLDVVHDELAAHGSVPGDLDVLARKVFDRLPDDIREADTPVHRAELAGAIHCAILFNHRFDEWMATP